MSTQVYDPNPAIAALQKRSREIYDKTGRWDTPEQAELHKKANEIRAQEAKVAQAMSSLASVASRGGSSGSVTANSAPSSTNPNYVGFRSELEKQGHKVDWNPNTKNMIVDGVEIDSRNFAVENDHYVGTQSQLQQIINNVNAAKGITGATTTNLKLQAGSDVGYNAAPPPEYKGLSDEDFKQAILDKARAGADTAANAKIALINRNLSEILAALDREKGVVEPTYNTAIENIGRDEFMTKERRQEELLGSGWTQQNSGLLQGELTRIANAANKARAETETKKASDLADIERRTQLAEKQAAEDILATEKERETAMSQAEAEALLAAETRNYQKYKDALDLYLKNRDFDYNVSKDTKYFQYQLGRDLVKDLQFMEQMTLEETNIALDNAVRNKQLDQADKELALKIKEFDWARDPKNPDNIYKQAAATSQEADAMAKNAERIYEENYKQAIVKFFQMKPDDALADLKSHADYYLEQLGPQYYVSLIERIKGMKDIIVPIKEDAQGSSNP